MKRPGLIRECIAAAFGSVYVRDTTAAKSVREMLILKGARKVATVQVHYGNSGSCLVNIWQECEAAARSAAAREKVGKPFKAVGYETPGAFQYACAGGYGHDKLTAALSGMNIDGHELRDHCGARLKTPKGLAYLKAIGYTVCDVL